MKKAIVTLGLGLCACGPAGPAETLDPEAWTDGSASILYGQEAEVGEFPAVGHLTAFTEGRAVGPLCTATLIAPDVVLTAAHCFEGTEDAEEQYFIRDLTAFRFYQLRNERWSLVRATRPHPDYVPLGEDLIADDVALIFLDEPVRGVETFPALADDRIEAALVIGAPATIVGYGRDEAGLSGILRHADTRVSFVGDRVLRTGARAPAPSRCSGDSGGPTFMLVDDGATPRQRLVGVNSYGYESCDSASTEARVDGYLDWIAQQMGDACDDGTRSVEACADHRGPRLADPATRTPPNGPGEPPPLRTPDVDEDLGPADPARTDGGCRGGGGAGAWLALGGLLGLLPRRRRPRAGRVRVDGGSAEPAPRPRT